MERGCWRPEACPGKAGGTLPSGQSGQGQDTVVGEADYQDSPLELSQPWEMLPDLYGVLAMPQALDYPN